MSDTKRPEAASTEMLDRLSFDFFREFARCEYCLKVVGLRTGSPSQPIADWLTFANEVQNVFNKPRTTELEEAVSYYLSQPPKKQVIKDGTLAWENVLPSYSHNAELILLLIRRVRNNLFHGGKFNGHWFEPERSEALLRHGLTIMQAAVRAHETVREAYVEKAT